MVCIRGCSFVPHESLKKVSQPLTTVMKVTVKDHDREEMPVTKGERSDFGTPGLTGLHEEGDPFKNQVHRVCKCNVK